MRRFAPALLVIGVACSSAARLPATGDPGADGASATPPDSPVQPAGDAGGAMEPAPDARTAARLPNVILIVGDDLSYGLVGAYGQKKIRTPNIDRLAREGMRFRQFYADSVCAVSRSLLMTGLHGGHTPVRYNGIGYLADEDVTLAEVARKAGYATGGFGKWGLGMPDTPGEPSKQGFDQWFGQYSQLHAHFHYPAFLMENLAVFPLEANLGRKRAVYEADVTHQRALAFIEANRTRPFFAYLPYTLPHVELVCPPELRRAYEGLWPRIARPDPRGAPYIGSDDAYAEFACMVTRLDTYVGEIMALLGKLGLDGDTVVMVAGDNGPQGDEWADIVVEFFGGGGPFRGQKFQFYEGGIRVPFIVRWPGHIAAGATSDHVGYLPDVLPTVAELVGATAHLPASLDGLSIVPTLLGQPGRQPKHDYLYWEQDLNRDDRLQDIFIYQQAVRWGSWKAVAPGSSAGPQAWELYDLASDPTESKDLAGDRPEVLARIRGLAAAAHTPMRKLSPDINREGIPDDYVH